MNVQSESYAENHMDIHLSVLWIQLLIGCSGKSPIQRSEQQFMPALRCNTPVIMGNNIFLLNICIEGFPGGAVVENPPANVGDARDAGSIPGSGRSPGGGNGNALQCSCLGNSRDRGAWWATIHGVTESDRTEHVHTHT